MKAFLFIITFLFVSDAFSMTSRPVRRRSVPVQMQPQPGGYRGSCYISNPTCGTSGVKVDVSARCMCIDLECFPVSIGSGGPGMTHNGTSRLGLTGGVLDRNSRGAGGTYETKSITRNSYDNDAIAMGIPRNDAVGKWFHKPANCLHPSRYTTAGCIAVPCEQWANLKSSIGEEVTVCGGRGSGGRFNSRPPSLSGMLDRVTENAAYVDRVQSGAVQ